MEVTWCRSQEECLQQCNLVDADSNIYRSQDSCPLPKAIKDMDLYSNQSSWERLKIDWREDGCRYPFAYEALLSLIVVLPFSFVCMIGAGFWLRKRTMWGKLNI